MNRQELLQQIEQARQELTQPGVVASIESDISESAKKYLAWPIQISADLELYPLKNPDCVAHPLIDGWYLIEDGDDYVFVSTSSGYVLIPHSPPAYVVAMVNTL